jgi:3-methyladenine DNA glycosylase Tag
MAQVFQQVDFQVHKYHVQDVIQDMDIVRNAMELVSITERIRHVLDVKLVSL